MFVYILTNFTNTVLYIGVTNNLERRIWEHKSHLFKNSFTDKYKIYKLLWFQEFTTPEEAIIAEKKIKGWNRQKKINLIKEMNSELRELNT